MAQQQKQKQCKQCGQPTLFVRNTYDVPHLMHLLATVFLCGLWLPIWILHACSNLWSGEPFRCSRCGSK